MGIHAGRGLRLWLLTLTAPSTSEHLRWTVAQDYRRGAPRPSCGCHEGVVLADWNPDASACWNRLATALRDHGLSFDYYRATEVQDGKRGSPGRGALHHHVVIAADSMLPPSQLQSLALAAGYGCVIDLRLIASESAIQDVAGYVSKTLAGYISKSSGEHRLEVPWRREYLEDPTTGEVYDQPRRLHTVPTYKTHTQSQGWGCTVREVKAIAQAQARRRARALAALTPDRDWTPDGTWLGSDVDDPAGVLTPD